MKILFASLMCLVFGTVQSFAISGGPVYTGATSLIGSYAGVMQGVFDPTNPASSNSIGIFSLAVPATGNATGAFVMFSRGRVFTGTAQAFADPNKSSLKGIVSATYNYTLNIPSTDSTTGVTTIVSTSVTASANGPLNAKIATVRTRSGTSSASTTILRGDATLNISQGGIAANGDPTVVSILSLVVSGVRQSTAAPAAATTTGG